MPLFAKITSLIFALLAFSPKSFGAETFTNVIPLPVYATLPNEGSTFGFMPVFMTVEEKDQRTQSIIAPSITWNRLIQYTATFRLYYYPTSDDVINFIPSVSTKINRNLTLEYFRLPRAPHHLTHEAAFNLRRSVFYRFFGLGPNSSSLDESSYTRTGGDIQWRVGYNIAQNWNLGTKVIFERHLAERENVDFLPLMNQKFPDVPGLQGVTTAGQFISLRFDTRPDREYSTSGFFTEAQAGVLEGLSGTSTLGKFQIETKGMWPETSFMGGAARAFWSYTAGREIPFFHQSSLGGSYRLRGFTEDRFIDKGSWEIELEQRIAYLQTKIFDVIADWRIDPFVAVGQVYSSADEILDQVNFATGLGFRAFVRPNVLGRVDVAYAGEGIKVYVELGYPF